MSKHYIGDMTFGEPPIGFGSMNIVDQMSLEQGLRETRERRQEQEQKAAELALTQTVEIEGDTNE